MVLKIKKDIFKSTTKLSLYHIPERGCTDSIASLHGVYLFHWPDLLPSAAQAQVGSVEELL